MADSTLTISSESVCFIIIKAREFAAPDVVTDPEHRRQGYGTALLYRIFAWAQQFGATNAALQVQADNAPARALYARLGFREVYRYWYRVSP